jgi:Tol biopolymer transport system component/DNA-binding winged helix-turn-helix (wHTH) protein
MKDTFRIGDWQVEPQSDRIIRADQTVKLEPRVMQVLVYLAERAGDVVTREELLKAVWEETFVTDEVLTSAIRKLRRAFGDEGVDPAFIQTVPKKGYRLNASVSEMKDQSALLPRREVATAPIGRMRTFFALGLAVVAVGSGIYLLVRPQAPSETTSVRPLTSSVDMERYPTWSPGGSLVAFSRAQSGSSDIFVIPAAGGDEIRLTETDFDEYLPRWSPDGRYIAFASDHGTGTNIYLIPPLGGTPKKLVEARGFGEALGAAPWSPDGQELYFSRSQPTGQMAIWKVNLATGNETQVTYPAPQTDHAWATLSFDGKWIVYGQREKGRGTLWLLPAAGGEPRLLFDEPYINVHPAFSADNERIVFGSNRAGLYSLWELEIGSGRMRRLTTSAGESPVVSQSGALAYTHTDLQTELYTTESETGREEQLSVNMRGYFSPRFSPDGKKVLYQSRRTGNSEIWLLDLESGDEHRLTDNPAHDMGPDWSPDGRHIAFLSNREEGQYHLWVMTGEGDGLERLSPQAIEPPYLVAPYSLRSAVRWSPDGKAIGYLSQGKQSVDLWVVDPDGTHGSSRLFGVLYFDWYRDSRHVVYSRAREQGEGSEIVAVDLESGKEAVLHEGRSTQIAMARDGGALAFRRDIGPMNQDLYVLRLEPPKAPGGLPQPHGTPERLTNGQGRWQVHNGGWSPDGKKLLYIRATFVGDIYLIENYH